MTDKEPTKEQIKEFWEWCGFTLDEEYQDLTWWNSPDGGYQQGLPAIDLNNLFKYAVPKLEEDGWDWYISPNRAILQRGNSYYEQLYSDHNPALALFWAIYQLALEP